MTEATVMAFPRPLPDEAVCLIWSNEHRAWWGPMEHGYVREVRLAGRYPLSRAVTLVTNAQRGRRRPEYREVDELPDPPPELIVRVVDVEACGVW